jgi:hypothetical protein
MHPWWQSVSSDVTILREWQIYLGLCGLGDRLHREPLSCVVREAAEDNQSDLRAFLIDYIQYIFFPKPKLALPRRDLDYGILGVKPVVLDLRSESVLEGTCEYPLAHRSAVLFVSRATTNLIRWKGSGLAKELVPL